MKLPAAPARLRIALQTYREPLAVGLGARVAVAVLAFVAGLYLPGLPPGGTAQESNA